MIWNITFAYKKARGLLGMVVLACLLGSCVADDFSEYDDHGVSSADAFTLTVQSNKMLPLQVRTRAADPKDDAEKEINQLYLFFLDADGQYLKEYQHRFIGFQKPSPGQSTIKVDRNAINQLLDEHPNKTVTVYAVANVEPETFTDNDGDGRPDAFEGGNGKTPLQQLQEYVYKPTALALGLPDDGMPMVGSKEVDFSKMDVNSAIIDMKALMARVDVTIQLDSEVGEGNLPALSLMTWTVLNAPKQVAFTAPAEGNFTGALAGKLSEEETETPYTGGTIYNQNGVISFSFYMFENIQNKNDATGVYPEGVTADDPEAQRYKPRLADTDNAAAVQLHAFYSTYNDDGTGSATYDVTYTLYLGANHTDDFKVKRNHQYKNDITIKGLTQVGTNHEHITFDARVNVVEDNPFYIAILRERNHDAHFCVTPMDVYLFDGGTMKVTLGDDADEDGKPWIRMEKVSADVMKSGKVQDDDLLGYPEQAWHAGTGKRKYFTKGLLNKLSKEETLNHRDRVYFYLDENLKLSDRQVEVTLTYTPADGGTPKERKLVLAQTHLLPVDVYDRKPSDWDDSEDGEWKPTFQKRIYMEAYEEYLNHYDPLNEFSTSEIYSGLPWAEAGTTLANTEVPNLRISLLTGDERELENAAENYYSGWGYTSYMVQKEGDPMMTLNTLPNSAAEYCYNKNVRQDDGTVPWNARNVFLVGWTIYTDGSKWFLPGIREMEDALKSYYTSYSEFQDNFYWSSSAAKREFEIGDNPLAVHQSSTHARATKVLSNGKYAESGSHGDEDEYTGENGIGGKALRTQSLRIRAFRVDLNPVE